MPTGRIYQSTDEAPVDGRVAGVDLVEPAYAIQAAITETDGRVFTFDWLTAYEPRWFERGTLSVLDGAAAGLSGQVKLDRVANIVRTVELWDTIRGPIVAGDRVRLVAGYNRTFESARLKFGSVLDFRGFPDIPGEDWVVAYPTSGDATTGGSRR